MIYEDYETNFLEKIEGKINTLSEMTREEREFFNGLIRYHKPKKILEVGVSAGASSSIILNACSDYEVEIHSIDYFDKWYRDREKNTGFLVSEAVGELADGWHLHTGTIAAKFMDKIGGDIDFCLLDTVHSNPGEFLDFLMILPYLKPDAIVVLHDVGLHTIDISKPWFHDPLTTNGTLFSALRGQRFLPSKKSYEFFANIGAIKLAPDLREDLWPFFNLLTLPWKPAAHSWDDAKRSNWGYLKAEEWSYMEEFVARHYPLDLQLFFQKIITYKDAHKHYNMGLDHQAAMRNDVELAKGRKTPVEERKHPVKTLIDFIKSYFIFPWYIYKTYKKVGKIKDFLDR